MDQLIANINAVGPQLSGNSLAVCLESGLEPAQGHRGAGAAVAVRGLPDLLGT